MISCPGSRLRLVEHSESDHVWSPRDENQLDVCQTCADPLCGGSCERGFGQLIAMAGIIGVSAITLVVLLQIALR